MAKLHELLAVEGDLKSTASKILNESIDTFNKRKHLFTGQVKTYSPSDEGGEKFEPEIKKVEYTVEERLDYTMRHLGKFIDANYQKELSNKEATGDIIVGGKPIAEKIPATMLLSLEKYLTILFNVYKQIPTLDPGKDWKLDDKEKDIFKAKDKPQYRTQKKTTPVVLYQATKEHPAQVKEVTEDIRVGVWDIELQSACLSPRKKSEYLEKIEKLIGAIKKARARANEQNVPIETLAEKLFAYIKK
jgi:hypothetical protein